MGLILSLNQNYPKDRVGLICSAHVRSYLTKEEDAKLALISQKSFCIFTSYSQKDTKFFNHPESMINTKLIRSFLTIKENGMLRLVSKRSYFFPKNFNSKSEYERSRSQFFLIAFRYSIRSSFSRFEETGTIALRRHIFRYAPTSPGFLDVVMPFLVPVGVGFLIDRFGARNLEFSIIPSCVMVAIALRRARGHYTRNLASLWNKVNLFASLMFSLPFRYEVAYKWTPKLTFNQCHPLESLDLAAFFLLLPFAFCVNYNFPEEKEFTLLILNVTVMTKHSLFAIVNSLFVSTVISGIHWSELEHIALKKMVATYCTIAAESSLLLRHTFRQIRNHPIQTLVECGVSSALLYAGGIDSASAVGIGMTAVSFARATRISLPRGIQRVAYQSSSGTSKAIKSMRSRLLNVVDNLLLRISGHEAFYKSL